MIGVARIASTEATLDRQRPAPGERLGRLARVELDRSFRLAGLILGNAADAEDAVGDALERAIRSIHGLRDDTQFPAWFDRIVVNACRDRLRRRRIVRFVPMDEAGDHAGNRDPFAAVLHADAATRAIDILPTDERVVVILRFWADLQVDAIATRLGVPAGTVKSRLHRALGRMRAEVDR